MRLWHKALIPVLPRQQLLGQWREVCLIAKEIKEKGTPNHLLVNKVTEYPAIHLYYYATLVCNAMEQRGYKPDFWKFCRVAPTLTESTVTYESLFEDWHNDRYLLQCYYNLQEKFDCGGISKDEFCLIRDAVTMLLEDKI